MELIAGGGVSIVCSLLLWFFLPRGVVLTSTELSYEEIFGGSDDEPDDEWPDDEMIGHGGFWRVKNESPLPVRILKATVRGLATYNEATGKLDEIDVTDSDDDYLILDTEGDPAWRGYIVDPGNTFTASVGINTDLLIRYRRAGWSGVLERRQLSIFGGL
ncbi:MAG: hypothetical protein F4118_11240 [Acidimicrobiaceae bacterium]|nr:hypothetical protein [Acidimicrobiaceae bacterium]MYI36981.1 hypothetical protein [Acidimicrobiaceae bacterium]